MSTDYPLPPKKFVTFSPPFSIVGKSLPRIDAVAKVIGRLDFHNDLHPPNMLYGRMLHSAYAHATLDIDTSAAEALPGVKAVVTYRDVIPKVPISVAQNHYILDTQVKYAGEEIAAVAADDPYIAEDALELLKVTYTPLPFVLDPQIALTSNAPQVHGDATPFTEKGNLSGGKPMLLSYGDAKSALASSDITVQGTYTTQSQWHTRLVSGCLCDFSDGVNLTVYEGTQDAHGDANTLSRLLGIPINRVHVNAMNSGARFGSSSYGNYLPIAALLSRKAGMPVRLMYTNTEDAMPASRRGNMVFNVTLGAKNDGTLTGFDVSQISDIGPYGFTGPLGYGRMIFFDKLKVPNGNFVGYGTYTNKNSLGPFRGFGGPESEFACNIMHDRLAEQLGIDFVDLCIKTHRTPGDPQPSTMVASGAMCVLSAEGWTECLTKGAQLIDWKNKRHAPGKGPTFDETKKRGVGAAMCIHEMGSGGMYTAIVEVKRDGSVVLLEGNSDMGQGLRTCMAQVVAEVMGVPYENVSVINADSILTQYVGSTVSSQAMYNAGRAAALAAYDAKQQMLTLAVPVLGASQPADLDAKDGVIFVKANPTKTIKIGDLVRQFAANTGTAIIGRYAGNVSNVPPNPMQRISGAEFIEVEVDTETGQVSVINRVPIHNVGTAVNPNVVMNQIQGGSIMGLGFARTENPIYDQGTGRLLNPHFYDYGLLTSADDVYADAQYTQVPEPLSPMGCSGIGEEATVPVAAALANAVYNAIGVRINDLPITPDKVLAALGKV
jgi:xanthine dehydrogenase molybdenum-binding subunit